VINFAGEEHLMSRELITADATGKKRGEDFVSKLRPNGGTNINDSLIASLKQFDNNGRPKMLVFMTDGLATVGEANTERIVANLAKAKNVDVRIFPFGFGYDVNTALLDKIGTENGGISDYVQPKEDLEVKVSNFFSRVSSPVLSGLELDFGPVEAEMMYPRKLGDLFKGMQLAVIGRYKNSSDLRNITLLLKGKTGKESKSFSYDQLDFPEHATENEFLPRLWASRRVGWLVEEIRINGETKELKDEVMDLGTKYGIVTPYTSYLATDGSFVSTSRDARGRPVMAPRAAERLRAISGADSVQMSVQQNRQKENAKIAIDGDDSSENQVLVRRTATNQFVGNRNFYFENNAWVDSEYVADRKLPETNLKFASEEYFKLIERERELAKYLAIGDEVVVVWRNRVYRVTK
jgi:Ca-activated chloride channel family protein